MIRAMALVLLVGCANTTRTHSSGDVEVLTLRRDFANTHVVQTDQGSFLVDPGSELGVAEMDDAIRGQGIDPATLRAVVFTHGHADHAGAGLFFRETYDLPLIGGAGDAPLFESGMNDELCPTNNQAERLKEDHQDTTYTAFTPDIFVSEAMTLETVGLPEVTVMPLAGHTPGSLLVMVGETVFAGDTLRGSVLGSSARTHYFICDEQDNRQDVAQMLELGPTGQRYFFGHFGPVDRDDVQQWLDDN